MRNIFLASNLVYLAPIRDNSGKRKWFRFLTFKINSSLAWRVSQNLGKRGGKKEKQEKFLKFFFPVALVETFIAIVWLPFEFEHLLSHQNQLRLRENSAGQPNTVQSWSVRVYVTGGFFGFILNDAHHGQSYTIYDSMLKSWACPHFFILLPRSQTFVKSLEGVLNNSWTFDQ